MKNSIKFLIAIIALALLQSCEKESEFVHEDSDQNISINEQDSKTGEGLAELYINDNMDIEMEKLAITDSYKKEYGKMSLVDKKNNSKFLAKSRYITNIYCGDTDYGTTKGETNTVSKYRGADKVYLLDINNDQEVELKLTGLSSDLDLFITSVKIDGFGRKLIGNYLSSSTNGSSRGEEVKVSLKSGQYFIIVDTYSQESDFTLSVQCSGGHNGGGPFYHCENFERLSYTRGIAAQSNLWNKWSSRAGDGRVKYFDRNYNNKVVKFDYSRFRYQDCVRDLIGLPLNHGWYWMSFDLYNVSGKTTHFLSEKTARYGQEQGFHIEIENGRLTVYYKGRSYTANTRIPTNTWTTVYISFDMTYNTIRLYIDGIEIIMDADAQRNSFNTGRKSIQGIDFFTRRDSKFNVDNVCILELEPGYDNPISTYSISNLETIDLR